MDEMLWKWMFEFSLGVHAYSYNLPDRKNDLWRMHFMPSLILPKTHIEYEELYKILLNKNFLKLWENK